MEAHAEGKVTAGMAERNEEQRKQQRLAEEENKKKNKRKRKEFAPYGNYRSYYGYRLGNGFDEDPRLKVMRKEWFEGKTCLDIGCNNGLITIHIAKKFGCQSILGIDIDSNRIEDAYWNLRKAVKVDSKMNNCTKFLEPNVEETSSSPEKVINPSLVGDARNTSNDSPQKCKDFSAAVSFRQENFVESWRSLSEHYDTILCLSVTKWVHLNWGDEGLISLFSKVWRLLRPGGVFIVEPQPWRSYEQNRNASEAASKNYHRIMFRPHYFQEILLDRIGFRTVEDLTAALSGAKEGFNRPVLAFYK